MKKTLLLLLFVPFIFMMIGCEEEPTEAIDPPSGLSLRGADNELYLEISWTASSTSDIDGYRIYYDNDPDPLYEGTLTSYTHGASGTAPELGEYEIVAYRGSEESDALEFDTDDYVNTGTFTVYDMDAPIGYDSGVGFNSNGAASTFSMSDTENGPYVDFYYDSDGTFTSANYLGGDWVNETGFLMSVEPYNDLDVCAITGHINYTNPAVADGQVWQVVIRKTSTTEWHHAKFRIDAVTTTPNVKANVTFAYQTIEGWARVD